VAAANVRINREVWHKSESLIKRMMQQKVVTAL